MENKQAEEMNEEMRNFVRSEIKRKKQTTPILRGPDGKLFIRTWPREKKVVEKARVNVQKPKPRPRSEDFIDEKTKENKNEWIIEKNLEHNKIFSFNGHKINIFSKNGQDYANIDGGKNMKIREGRVGMQQIEDMKEEVEYKWKTT